MYKAITSQVYGRLCVGSGRLLYIIEAKNIKECSLDTFHCKNQNRKLFLNKFFISFVKIFLNKNITFDAHIFLNECEKNVHKGS